MRESGYSGTAGGCPLSGGGSRFKPWETFALGNSQVGGAQMVFPKRKNPTCSLSNWHLNLLSLVIYMLTIYCLTTSCYVHHNRIKYCFQNKISEISAHHER